MEIMTKCKVCGVDTSLTLVRCNNEYAVGYSCWQCNKWEKMLTQPMRADKARKLLMETVMAEAEKDAPSKEDLEQFRALASVVSGVPSTAEGLGEVLKIIETTIKPKE